MTVRNIKHRIFISLLILFGYVLMCLLTLFVVALLGIGFNYLFSS